MTQYNTQPPLKKPYATHQLKTGTARGLIPEQLVGLVPCQLANFVDCRPTLEQCIEVFAKVGGEERENDSNSFLFEFPTSLGSNNSFFLQQLQAGVWVDVANLNNNDYGQFYNFGAFPSYPNYSGYRIDWQTVLADFGEGTYRFIVVDTLLSNPDNTLYSYPFVLEEFTCDKVDLTIKFEATFKGEVNSFYKEVNNSRLASYDLVNISNGWYDSMRYKGRLGGKEYGRENMSVVKLATNQNELVYSKNVEIFNMVLYGYVEELLTRLVLFGCNSMDIYATDYNYQAKYYYEKIGLVFDTVKTQPTYLQNTNKAWRMELSFKRRIDNVFQKGGIIR